MFDGRTETFERAVQLSGASIIAATENKVVMLRQKQPGTDWYYSIPGGYLDKPGETPKQGALRELLEETGMKPRKITLWKKKTRFGRLINQHYIFVAQGCKKVADQDLDGGEKIEVNLVSFEEFLKFADNDNFHNERVSAEMLKARLSLKSKTAFKKLLFG